MCTSPVLPLPGAVLVPFYREKTEAQTGLLTFLRPQGWSSGCDLGSSLSSRTTHQNHLGAHPGLPDPLGDRVQPRQPAKPRPGGNLG